MLAILRLWLDQIAGSMEMRLGDWMATGLEATGQEASWLGSLGSTGVDKVFDPLRQ